MILSILANVVYTMCLLFIVWLTSLLYTLFDSYM